MLSSANGFLVRSVTNVCSFSKELVKNRFVIRDGVR